MIALRRIALALAWLASSALACAEPMKLIDAVAPPDVLQATLSPDGRHVAAITNTTLNHDLVLIRTDDFTSRTVIEGKWVRDGTWRINKNPRRVHWITATTFAVDYGIVAEAYDLQGKRVAELGTAVLGRVDRGSASPKLLVYEDEKRQRLAVVDVMTGKSRSVSYPMSGRLVDYAFDEQGGLRVVALANSEFWNDRTTVSTWYQRLGSNEWQKLAEIRITEETWTPLVASADRDELIVASREGRDTYAIFAYDPIKQQRGEMLAGHPTEDIVSFTDLLAGQYLSVATLGMKPATHWFDGRWAGLQSAVDRALPQRVNRLTGNPRGRVLVFSYGDVDPGRWYLLDTSTMALRLVLVARPHIEPSKMRPMEVIRFAAPDGLQIPAYLTRPTGGDGPRPMVVMVHGGPAIRDHWDWDAEVQALASRGYVVFQPQFRGSTGFGKAFEAAGRGQWGRAMQDDITAGVEHLIKTGVADPKRICIYGSSYGGYAAVWGLAKTPELYRCGVSFAGVTDIDEMLTDWSDTNSDKAAREWQRFALGTAERQRFDDVSPVKHAARIRAPLLISHGEEDERVPIGHSKRLMRALDAHGKTYEWLPLKREGHGRHYLVNEAMFIETMLKFFDKHLAEPAPAR